MADLSSGGLIERDARVPGVRITEWISDLMRPRQDSLEPPGAGSVVRGEHGRKIADIEVLRGISIIFVIASHMPSTLLSWHMPVWQHIITHYFNTWSGVDLFLAISGFVIGRSLLPKLAGAGSGRDFASFVIVFWVRRAWRLLPSAWLWLGIILILAAVFNSSGAFGRFHDNFESTIAGLLSIANLRFAYVFKTFSYGASTPYWSLSLEEQFYFLLPIIVWLSGRRLAAVLAVILGLFAFIPDSTYTGVFRVQPILLGVLLAQFARHEIYRMVEPKFLAHRRWVRLVSSGLLLAILASLCSLEERIAPFIRFQVIAVLAALLVFIASYDKGYICQNTHSKTIMLWFGSRSYGLYLTHVPAFCATREMFFRAYPRSVVFDNAYDWPFIVVGLGLAVLLAELNYRFVEHPLRERGVRIAARMAGEYGNGERCPV